MSPFRPFQDAQSILGAVQDEMNRIFDRVWHGGVSARPFDGHGWSPAIDLYEFDDRFVVLIEIPGVDVASLEVTYGDHALTLRGHKPRPGGVGPDTPSLLTERRYGSFSRTIALPGGVSADQITAKSASGVLEVVVPKSESSRSRTIRVEVAQG